MPPKAKTRTVIVTTTATRKKAAGGASRVGGEDDGEQMGGPPKSVAAEGGVGTGGRSNINSGHSNANASGVSVNSSLLNASVGSPPTSKCAFSTSPFASSPPLQVPTSMGSSTAPPPALRGRISRRPAALLVGIAAILLLYYVVANGGGSGVVQYLSSSSSSSASSRRGEGEDGQYEGGGLVGSAGPSSAMEWGVAPQNKAYEDAVAAVLHCHKVVGKRDGVNHYYSMTAAMGGGACVPMPQSAGGFNSYADYQPPRDPTLVPLLSTLTDYTSYTPQREEEEEEEGSGGRGVGGDGGGGAHHRLIVAKTSPSIHSRWLLDDWRLWEGELPCSNRRALRRDVPRPALGIFPAKGKERDASTLLPLSAFITKGSHKAHLPSAVYELENFCIDEDAGNLYAFDEASNVPMVQSATTAASAAAAGSSPPPPSPPIVHIFQHEGIAEHPFSHRFSAMPRLLSEHNRVTVPLVGPTTSSSAAAGGGGSDAGSIWRQTVKASLSAYYLRNNNATQTKGNDRPPYSSPPLAEVLFVDDPAIMMPVGAFDSRNPGHMFHRTGPPMALGRILGATSFIFLVDVIGQEVRDVYTTLHRRNSDKNSTAAIAPLSPSIPLIALLPEYLQLPLEALGEGGAPITVVRDAKGRALPRQDGTLVGGYIRSNHRLPDALAVSDAKGSIGRYMPFAQLAGPMLSTGERGCEAFRCGATNSTLADLHDEILASHSSPSSSSGPLVDPIARLKQRECAAETIAAMRRCGRPYVALNVALNVRWEAGFAGDTQNYPPTVWNRAVKEASREAKRLRRLVWEAAALVRSGGALPKPKPADSTMPLPIRSGDGGANTKAGTAAMVITATLRQYDWYMAKWRDRLVYRAAMAGGGSNAGRNDAAASFRAAYVGEEKAYADYFGEYFAYRLEYEALLLATAQREREQEGQREDGSASVPSPTPTPTPPKQLVCYRTAYVSHNHHLKRNPTQRGGLAQLAVPNCNDRETFKNVYESGLARYGMCPTASAAAADDEGGAADGGGSGSSGSTASTATMLNGPLAEGVTEGIGIADRSQWNNTNRAAHPIFVLPKPRREGLQALFESSRRAVESLLSKGAPLAGDTDLHKLLLLGAPITELRVLPAVGALVDAVAEAQRTYDAAFMAYFRNGKQSRDGGGDNSEEGLGRPISLFYAARTGARQVQHTRLSISKLFADPNVVDGLTTLGTGRGVGVRADLISSQRRRGRGSSSGPSSSGAGANANGGGDSSSTLDDRQRSMADYINLNFEEAMSLGMEGSPSSSIGNESAAYDPRRPLRNPRSAQFYKYLTTDLMIGLHGSDMHGTAYLKPSGLSLEISMVNFDSGGGVASGGKKGKANAKKPRFESGYFSQIGAAKNIAYLRILANAHWVRSRYPNDPEGILAAYLSLPEWRHTLSTAVCTWLSFNAVRLADEERERHNELFKATSSNTKAGTPPPPPFNATDYSYLTPWWCRGGALDTIEEFRKVLRSTVVNQPISAALSPQQQRSSADASLSLLPVRSNEAAYFARRSASTSDGFGYPLCPPLAPRIALAAGSKSPTPSSSSSSAGGSAVSIDVSIGQAQLNRLQTDCVQMITLIGKWQPTVREVEAMQSLLEAGLMMEATRAAAVADLIMRGAAAVGVGLPRAIAAEGASSVTTTTAASSLSGDSDENAAAAPTTATDSPPPTSSPSSAQQQQQQQEPCGHLPLNGNEECARRLVRAALHPQLGAGGGFAFTPAVLGVTSGGVASSFVASLMRVLSPWNEYPLAHYPRGGIGDAQKSSAASSDQMGATMSNPIAISNATQRAAVSDWIVWNYFTVPGRQLAGGKAPPTKTGAFTYGSRC